MIININIYTHSQQHTVRWSLYLQINIETFATVISRSHKYFFFKNILSKLYHEKDKIVTYPTVYSVPMNIKIFRGFEGNLPNAFRTIILKRRLKMGIEM